MSLSCNIHNDDGNCNVGCDVGRTIQNVAITRKPNYEHAKYTFMNYVEKCKNLITIYHTPQTYSFLLNKSH